MKTSENLVSFSTAGGQVTYVGELVEKNYELGFLSLKKVLLFIMGADETGKRFKQIIKVPGASRESTMEIQFAAIPGIFITHPDSATCKDYNDLILSEYSSLDLVRL